MAKKSKQETTPTELKCENCGTTFKVDYPQPACIEGVWYLPMRGNAASGNLLVDPSDNRLYSRCPDCAAVDNVQWPK